MALPRARAAQYLRRPASPLLFSCLLALASAIPPGTAAEPPPPTPAPTPTAVTPAIPGGPVADNRRCFVCHANYDFFDEPLALVHAQANIGCIHCHGESSPHSTDEDGLTPPDRMYAPSRVRFNCLGCHDYKKIVANDAVRPPRPDLEELPNHAAVLAGTAEKKFCTDCHGDHRLGHRTRTWNKRTGALTYRDSTPRMLGP